jgi:hypothetical protein
MCTLAYSDHRIYSFGPKSTVWIVFLRRFDTDVNSQYAQK